MSKEKPFKVWKLTLVAALAVAGVAVLSGLFHSGFAPHKMLLFWAIGGAAIGIMLVPEMEPRATKHPALWQMACGMVGAGMISTGLGASPLGIFVWTGVGMILGFLAPYWLKHISF